MASRQRTRRDELLDQQAVLAEFGEFALRTDDLDPILNKACRLVGRVLGTDLAKVMERQADGRTLLVRAGVGWQPGLVGRLTTSTGEDTSTAHALATGEPCILADLARERRSKSAEARRELRYRRPRGEDEMSNETSRHMTVLASLFMTGMLQA